MVNPAVLLGAQRICYLTPYLSLQNGVYEHQSWQTDTMWAASWDESDTRSEPDD